MKVIDQVRQKDKAFAEKIVQQDGFLMDDNDVAKLAQLVPEAQVLVRCNGGRFITAAASVKHFSDIVERDFDTLSGGDIANTVQAVTQGADYVRDCSLLAKDL